MKPSRSNDESQIKYAVGQGSLGCVLVAASPAGLCAITLGDDAAELARDLQQRFPKAELILGDRAFAKRVAEIARLVERPASGFSLPLDVRGTEFQKRVWEKLRAIPCGETRSYAQIARAIGAPSASRAVAGACAANPIAVAIPCHRVVRADGSLSGYRWGVQRKAKLLKLERRGL